MVAGGGGSNILAVMVCWFRPTVEAACCGVGGRIKVAIVTLIWLLGCAVASGRLVYRNQIPSFGYLLSSAFQCFLPHAVVSQTYTRPPDAAQEAVDSKSEWEQCQSRSRNYRHAAKGFWHQKKWQK
jgi:hypothetical protein